MTQEEKQLLLKDLCGRIYYRPKGVLLRTGFDNEEIKVIGYDGHFVDFFRRGDYDQALIDRVRLYLRPMSSMTEEEKSEWIDGGLEVLKSVIRKRTNGIDNEPNAESHSFSIDWLNEHHFDYYGLIPMGLALEASEEMYQINKK